ncbi:MAG: type II toxin-antitoxin system HicA family toxin [Ardenticatenaceae bacterium]
MAQCDKLLRRAQNNPKGVRFADLLKLVKCFGFVFDHQTGSHHIYRHPLYRRQVNIQPDRNNMAKPYQVKQVLAEIRTVQQLDQEQS